MLRTFAKIESPRAINRASRVLEQVIFFSLRIHKCFYLCMQSVLLLTHILVSFHLELLAELCSKSDNYHYSHFFSKCLIRIRCFWDAGQIEVGVICTGEDSGAVVVENTGKRKRSALTMGHLWIEVWTQRPKAARKWRRTRSESKQTAMQRSLVIWVSPVSVL